MGHRDAFRAEESVKGLARETYHRSSIVLQRRRVLEGLKMQREESKVLYGRINFYFEFQSY